MQQRTVTDLADFQAEYRAQYANLEFALVTDAETPDFDSLLAFVTNSIADQGDDDGKSFLLSLAGYRAFFDWLDTCTHYDQCDSDVKLADSSPWLAVIFQMLCAQFRAELVGV